MDQSTSRLNNMAAVLAKTMQITTSTSSRRVGRPRAATSSAPRAKGSAKTVCENLISWKNRAIALLGGGGSIGASTVFIQERFEARACAFQNGHSVGKEHSLEGIIEELGQGPPHYSGVGAVLWGE